MKWKHLIVAVATVFTGAAGITATTVVAAEAHTPAASVSCQGVVASGSDYNTSHGNANTYAVKVDNTTVKSGSFSGSFSVSAPVPQDTSAHPWSVQITAWDDPTGSHGWTKSYSGNIGPCVQVKHVTVSASFTDQTCADYQYTPATASHSDTEGVTWQVTGTPGPGATVTQTATANQGVKIDGDSSFSHTYPAHPNAADCTPPPCTACNLPHQHTNAPRVTDCRGILLGGVVNNVRVRPGRDCTLVNVYVNGSVRANGAHSLTMGGSTVRGSVYASHIVTNFTMGATNRTCSADPMVGGSVIAVGSHNVVLCNLQVCHAVVVKGATGRVMVRESRMSTLRVTHNNRYVKDGNPHHNLPGLIRLHDLAAHRYVIEHNARPVDKRHLRHVARIHGGKVCTLRV